MILGIVLVAGAIVFVLFFYKGTIKFNPTPATARIDVNGVSQTGANNIKLDAGIYVVKVSAPGYVSFVKTIQVKVARSVNLNIILKTLPKPEKIIDGTAKYLSPSQSLQELFYLGNNGRTIYRITNAETPELRKINPITPDVFSEITNLSLSPDQQLALYKKDAGTFLYDFNRYDLLHQELFNLGNEIGSIIWSPDNTKIAYYHQTPAGERTLIRANKDNTGQERIFNFKDTSIVNPALDWSANGQKILVVKDNIYVFDVYTKTLKQITSNQKIVEAKFTPDSSTIIFNRVDDKGDVTLCLSDIDGSNIRELSVKTTLNKITWFDQKNMLATLPNLTNSGESDKLVKLNIENFQETEYQYDKSLGKIEIVNPVLLLKKDKIFFLNSNTLYTLGLVATE